MGSASSNRLLPKLRVSSDCGTQPLANEAAAFADSRLVGREVALEVGAERVDQYDRLLAYVWTDRDSMFNEALLRKGLAQVYTVPPNDEYEGRFFDAQDRAASAGLGIWGLSYGRQLRQNDRGNGVGGDGCSPLAPEPPPQYQAPAAPVPYPDVSAAPASPPIVGGDLDCKDFGSLAEVRESIAAGDPYGLDADGDGSGCESRF